ncbi:MAG TPA: hypothetical protein DF774_02300 [Rheinheimera sp.]|uniref:hypothetical protein n=1 Tax=Rheinheimera sp. TaxID=1869214 RepID=UPI000EC0782B|nr:hypothetical protein [Rheinheimera sp.]HCU64572.1 hypothetical protein [Rheinheimera sp.]
MSGWIKLHRSLKDHFLFDFNEPDKALAWIDLLLSASFEDCKVHVKGRVINVSRGQFVVSQVTLQKRWGMSQNKVKRFLNLLENEGMVNVQTNDATTIITICNYDSYQEVQQQDERTDGRADERTTNEPRTTLKEDKEIKKISSNEEIITPTEKRPRSTKPKAELDFSGWPQLPSDQTLIDWLAMRKNAKATTTQTVINRFATELTKAVAAGYSVDQCIAECCARNWKGFQLTWLQNAGVQTYDHQNHGSHSSPTSQGRYENPTARVMRMAREAEQQLQGNRGTVIEAEFKRS